jgi:hypothetical protein
MNKNSSARTTTVYGLLHSRFPPDLARALYVLTMAVLITTIVLLAGFPESALRYARL